MGTLWAAAASRRTNLAVLFRGTSPVSILLKSLVRERGDDWSLACGWNIQYVLKRVACIRYSVAARSFWSEMRHPTRCDSVCCQYLHIGNVEVLEPSDNLGMQTGGRNFRRHRPCAPFCDILVHATCWGTIDTDADVDCHRSSREQWWIPQFIG